MRKFRQYLSLRENTQQPLDQPYQQFLTAFNQQFQADPNGSLMWLNNLTTKVLPQLYKTKYAEIQKTQQQQPQQQQMQQQPQQQVQQPQVQQ